MVKITCTLYIAVLTILTEHAFSYGKAVCMIIFIPSRVMLKETFVSMGTFWEPFEPPGQAGSLGLTPHHSHRLNWWGWYYRYRVRVRQGGFFILILILILIVIIALTLRGCPVTYPASKVKQFSNRKLFTFLHNLH